jgi:hypothetical protein
MRIPNPDPGELWTDINMQLFGNPAPTPSQTATMLGFVQNYLAQQQLNPQQTYDPKSVMRPKIRSLRPLVRFGAMPDLAQPLVRPCRDRRRS